MKYFNRENFIILIMVVTIIYFFLRNKSLKKKYNLLFKCIGEYEKIIDDQGMKNHEYNNQLLVLKGYIDNKKELKKYLDTIISDHRTGQNYKIRQLNIFPDGGLKELIYYKVLKMKEMSIKSYVYVTKEFSNELVKLDLNMNKDLSKLLGVLIDNAVDASSQSTQKEVVLDFKKDGNYIILKISNTYRDDIDISLLEKRGYTSKGIGHGFGLQIVRDIVKHNDKIEVVSDLVDDLFSQIIMIDLK